MAFNFQPIMTEQWADNRDNQTYEISQLYGREIYYLQATQIEENHIFGESISRDFLASKAHKMMSLRDNDTSYSGTESFGGFGLVPQYNDIQYIPVKWFTDLGIEPMEGDLIYNTENNTMFEIAKVGTLTDDYAGTIINNRKFVYKVFLRLYEMSDDNFTNFDTTPISEIGQFDAEVLNDLNADLRTEVESVTVATFENPFGSL